MELVFSKPATLDIVQILAQSEQEFGSLTRIRCQKLMQTVEIVRLLHDPMELRRHVPPEYLDYLQRDSLPSVLTAVTAGTGFDNPVFGVSMTPLS